MNRIYLIGTVLAVSMFSCNPRQSPPVVIFDGFAQGTTYHFALKTQDTLGLALQIDSVFAVVNNSASVYNPASLLNRLNRNETDSLDTIIAECITIAERVSRESDGLYDITIKPLTEAWGFNETKYGGLPNVDSLLQYVGYEKISIDSTGAYLRLVKQNAAMKIDLNSVAKGYTVDLMGRLMDSRGIEEYMIEIGGEIVARGTNAQGKPWRIGIDKPVDGNLVQGQNLQTILEMSDMGLATSGNYRKFFETGDGRKVVHTVNPKTGEATANNLLSATVIAATCAEADAYATMLMAMGLEDSKAFLETHGALMAYLVYSDDNGEFLSYYTPNMEELIAK